MISISTVSISRSSSSHSSSTAAAQGLGFRLQTVGVRVQCLLWLTEAVKSLDKAYILLHQYSKRTHSIVREHILYYGLLRP
jgi:hypothetical protein